MPLFTCQECGADFKRKHVLEIHEHNHHGKPLHKPHQCSHCYKSFRLHERMVLHERMHTGEKPFVCQECGKSFAWLSSLQAHIRIHTGEKPHCCRICERRFSQISSLQIHLRGHTGERPYVCSNCGTGFKQIGSLNSHKAHYHRVKVPHRCTICKKWLATRTGLSNHMRVHLSESSFQIQCKNSPRSFKTEPGANSQMARHRSSNSFPCVWCGCAFPCRYALMKHRKSNPHIEREKNAMLLRQKYGICKEVRIILKSVNFDLVA